MKIAVFARSLSHQSTGRGTVARELLEEMVREPSAPEIDLFAGSDVGLPHCRFHPARGGSALGDAWRILWGIGREVADLRPEVFWGTTHFLPRNLPASLPRVTTLLDVVWRDHPETVRRPNRMAAGWMEQGLKESARILCISEFTRERLAAHWPGLRDRAEVVPLAPNPRLKVPPDAAEIVRARFGLEGGYLLNVDTFEPRKNLRILLEAVRRKPSVTLVHCGPIGWNVDADLAFARSLSNVRLLGYVGEEDLGALYGACSAAVFPSIYEGFHLAPLDACSLGVPVLASDIPVHREVLREAAAYFPVADADELERRLRLIREDAAERRRLSEEGRRRAGEYSWAKSARAVLAALQRAADQGAGRRIDW